MTSWAEMSPVKCSSTAKYETFLVFWLLVQTTKSMNSRKHPMSKPKVWSTESSCLLGNANRAHYHLEGTKSQKQGDTNEQHTLKKTPAEIQNMINYLYKTGISISLSNTLGPNCIIMILPGIKLPIRSATSAQEDRCFYHNMRVFLRKVGKASNYPRQLKVSVLTSLSPIHER